MYILCTKLSSTLGDMWVRKGIEEISIGRYVGQEGKRRTFGWEICGSGVRIPHRQHDTNTAAAADAEADAEADAAAAVVSSGPFLAAADAADAADGAHARRSNTRLGAPMPCCPRRSCL